MRVRAGTQAGGTGVCPRFGMTVRFISEFSSVMGDEEISTDAALVHPYTITALGVY